MNPSILSLLNLNNNRTFGIYDEASLLNIHYTDFICGEMDSLLLGQSTPDMHPAHLDSPSAFLTPFTKCQLFFFFFYQSQKAILFISKMSTLLA